MFLRLTASRHGRDSQLWAKIFVSKIEESLNPSDFKGLTTRATQANLRPQAIGCFWNVKSKLFNATKPSFVFQLRLDPVATPSRIRLARNWPQFDLSDIQTWWNELFWKIFALTPCRMFSSNRAARLLPNQLELTQRLASLRPRARRPQTHVLAWCLGSHYSLRAIMETGLLEIVIWTVIWTRPNEFLCKDSEWNYFIQTSARLAQNQSKECKGHLNGGKDLDFVMLLTVQMDIVNACSHTAMHAVKLGGHLTIAAFCPMCICLGSL